MMRIGLTAVIAMALALPAAAQTLVVGNKHADTAGFIDLKTGTMVATRPTGPGPHEVAISPDGKTAAVVAYGRRGARGDSITLFDVASTSERKTIALGRHGQPHGVLWLPDGRHLAVTSEESGHLILVDTAQGAVADAIATDQQVSHMVALGPDAKRAYVANIASDSFTVIDLEQKKLIANVPAGEETEGIAVSADGSEIWVTNRGADTVMVFDAETFVQKAVIGTGAVPIRIALSTDGETAVVSNARAGSLSVIDTDAKAVTHTVALTSSGGDASGAPVTVLFHPDGGTLWASLTDAGEIAVVDTESWIQTGTLKAGAGSDGLGYSPLALDIR